jgi:ABC-type antimicrobial peptide transport system permease subunit
VTERTREIGIRMAIGAQASDVHAMIFKRGLLVAGAGIVVGVVAALLITRLFQNLLYGISASDPLTFLLIAALLALVAAAACFVPARRATKVDPLTALRAE